jgi:hypothetical protein
MMLRKVLGPTRRSRNGYSGHAFPGIRGGALALAFAFAVLALAGCGGGGNASPGAVDKGSGAPVATTPPGATNQPATGQPQSREIPPGREISVGGAPVQYTFREEWRRALAEAQRWRNGAYLVKAVGQDVNDDGVPSYWALAFIDKAEADAVFRVEIDPWGKITETEEVTGEGVISFVDQYTKRIPFDVIDSDEAVTIGKAALAALYNPARTRDPLIALGASKLTGGAVYWTYILFYESTAEYVSAQIDPLTGEVIPPK